MHKQWIQASGYLSVFLMPLLFVSGTLFGRPWLAFGVVVLIFPLARTVFGALPRSGAPEWSERIATSLDRLPVAYALVLVICVLVGTNVAHERIGTGAVSWIGLGLSLWMTLLFATCVAHELIHRRGKHQASLGHLLAGFCGYPVLGAEHLAHHGKPGDIERGEAAAEAEPMWVFAAKRMRRIGIEFLGPGAPAWRIGCRSPTLARTRAAMAATVLAAIAFASFAGWRGLVLYIGAALGVSFGLQLITYIQHWGLGDQAIGARVAYGRGWEDDCRFQAWVTLSISLHDQHHRDARRPFYRLNLSSDSPRLPTGYVLLMFASMVPSVWRRLMQPARARWLTNPAAPLSAGHRLTCFGSAASLDRTRARP